MGFFGTLVVLVAVAYRGFDLIFPALRRRMIRDIKSFFLTHNNDLPII